MLVKDIMTRNATTVQSGASLDHVAHLMRQANIGFAPVVDGKRLIGVVTDRDIVIRAVADNRVMKDEKIGTIMSNQPVWCHTADNINDAIGKMEKYQIRRLPVIDDSHVVVGVVTLGDIARRMSHAVSGEVLRAVSENGDLAA